MKTGTSAFFHSIERRNNKITTEPTWRSFFGLDRRDIFLLKTLGKSWLRGEGSPPSRDNPPLSKQVLIVQPTNTEIMENAENFFLGTGSVQISNNWTGRKSWKQNNTFSPGIVHDGVKPVSDCEHCAVSKLTPNGLLNELIGFQVHRGCGLVKNQDLTFTEQRTS